MYCGHERIQWNGWRFRTASVLIEERIDYINDIRVRRVKCADPGCRKSWTLRPPGLVPRRHFQLGAVAAAGAEYLFGAGASQSRVASILGCCRRSIARMVEWIADLADPAELARAVLEVAGQAVLVAVRPVAELARKGRSEGRRALLERAAQVLGQLEALALSMGLEPPGLASVVEAVCAGRDRVTTYRAPALPEFARRLGWRSGGRLSTHESRPEQTGR
jgi:hypothetical protein